MRSSSEAARTGGPLTSAVPWRSPPTECAAGSVPGLAQTHAEASVPDFDDVRDAYERVRRFVHRTPVLTCQTLNRLTGAELFLKCENLQKVGAFKFRGACNAVFSLPEEVARRGIVTHSSGNHAQAVSLAAKMRGIPAVVVMPRNAPAVKVDAVRGYGAEVVFCEPTLRSREETADAIIRAVMGEDTLVEMVIVQRPASGDTPG